MHDSLVLVTGSGVEIAVQSLIRIDHELLVIRGRISGSTDIGRVYFIPYTQIDYVGTFREVKEEEFREHFGNLELPPPELVAVVPSAVAPPVELPPAEPPAPEPEPQPAAEETPRVATPIKSAVLERFRQRGPNGSFPGVRPPGDA
jgi:hypothetical protein